MAKYVLRHGGISAGRDDEGKPLVHQPSGNPKKPTVLEMEPEEAAKINGPPERQLLPGVKPKPDCLQPLEEYEAELEGERAKAAVIARAKKPAEEPAPEPSGEVSPEPEKPKGKKAKGAKS